MGISNESLINNKDIYLENCQCDYVYNFILDNHHVMNVNNIPCVTLAHQVFDHAILSHEFFGTDKIIQNLKSVFPSQYDHGQIIFNDNRFKRNICNGLVDHIE